MKYHCLFCLTFFALISSPVLPQKKIIMKTPFTEAAEKSPVPLPEYPRPQLERNAWMCLNGKWDYTGGKSAPRASGPKEAISFKGIKEKILVPFSPESYLSGIRRSGETNMWYRRTFKIPPAWKGKHVLLNFGAVAFNTTVFINNKRIGTHTGSYDSFNFDITPYLEDKENTIIVAVQDLNDGKAPCGKCGPRGGSYTNFSGIWQTVWLEPVNDNYIRDISLIPDIGGKRVKVLVNSLTQGDITATVLEGEKAVSVTKGPSGRYFFIPVKNPLLWSPDTPFLYGLQLTLHDPGGHVEDKVESYFGMRDIRLQDLDGMSRPFLNGRFTMQVGLLDQGYWPDGLMTAPADDALKYDIETAKKAGFNLIRKHMKTEPQRWYYWCDKMGLMVWQDMPSIWYQNEDTARVRSRFRDEWKKIIDEHYNAPSIVTWVPFNENWGAFDVKEITAWTKQYDPSRLVDGNTGFNNNPSYQVAYGDPGNGDYIDTHVYVGPIGACAPDGKRAAALGEFGGVGLYVRGHMWPKFNNAYDFETTQQALTDRYVFLMDRVEQLMLYKGLSAVIYTQMTDVEDEINGILTYDRAVEKMDLKKINGINEAVIRSGRELNNGGN